MLWKRAGDLFDELVELAPDARATRLASILAADAELHRRVEMLLVGDAMADARLPPPGFGLTTLSSVRPTDPLGLIGETLSHFRVEAFVAAGGMGMVYRAEDLQLHRPVALKFITPRHGLSVVGRERFLREARAAAVLDHPNLCPVHEVGDSRAGLFLAMPWYAGETLRERLARERVLPVATALSIAAQIAAGLRHAHAAGIVHRDIKPANVMLLADGTVKLLDFGLVGLQFEVSSSRAIVGTIGYIAPEQLRHEPVDARADLWALGVLLYEMLTGVRPFAMSGDVTAQQGAIGEPVPRPSVHRPELDIDVEEFICALLQPTPGHRPPDAHSVLRRITELNARRVTATPRRSTRRSRVVAVVALAMLVAFGARQYAMRVPGSANAALEPRYQLVLADFAITGLDASLARPLADEVRRLFDDASGPTVLLRAHMNSALQRMRYQETVFVAPELAREVARREGADAVMLGEVLPLGNAYLATLRIRSAVADEEVVSASTTLQHPESELLAALALLTDSVRHRLQTSRRLERVSAPPRKLTTRSLRALQLVSQVRLNAPSAPGQHMAMLREALALDSTLAYAWLVIGNMLSSSYRTMLQDSAYANMYRLRDSLTSFEQAQVSGIYFTRVSWDRPRALAAYDRFLAEDSTEFRVILNKVELLNSVREFERAEAALRRYERALVNVDGTVAQRVIARLGLEDVTTADSLVAELARLTGDHVEWRLAGLPFRLNVATLRYDVADRVADSDARRAIVARVQGRLIDARRYEARADSARAVSWRVNAVSAEPVYTHSLRQAREALWVRAQPLVALAHLDSVFKRHPISRVIEVQHRFDVVGAAALYAAAGRPEQARAMLDTILVQSDSLTKRALYPLLQHAWGEVALAEGRTSDAMALLRQSELGADGLPVTPCTVCVLPLLARASERAGWADSAQLYWTKYATSVAVDRHSTDQWFLRQAYRRLERLHAQRGDSTRSATFAALGQSLWRRADPDLPP